MGIEYEGDKLEDVLRVVRENNRMLHAMRRNAFWGGVLKFAFYVVVLIVAPLWLYATYLAPMMEQVLATYQQIQGTGSQAQAQFGDIQKLFEQFKNGLPLPK